jgi:hypothetical protein
LLPRLGRLSSSPAWAASSPSPAGPPCSVPRVGLGAPASLRSPGGPPHPGLLRIPAWAGTRLASPAGFRPGWALGRRPGRLSRLGLLLSSASAGPDQEDPAWPGFLPQVTVYLPGWAGLIYSGWARPGSPWPRPDYLLGRPDYISTCRINPLWAEIHLIRGIFLIRLRLQRLVPVLGRLQAQTRTSSIIVCWSWDAPWLRPAYSTSPSQSYPQEEDKTDDMEILKTHARRQRPSTPRTVKMGQAHNDNTIHSTKYGTAVMTALQYDKTPVVSLATVYRVHA